MPAAVLASQVPNTAFYAGELVGQQGAAVAATLSDAKTAIDNLSSSGDRVQFGLGKYRQVPTSANTDSTAIKTAAVSFLAAMLPLLVIKEMMQMPPGNRDQKKKANQLMFDAESFDKFLANLHKKLKADALTPQQLADHAGTCSASNSSHSSCRP